MRRKKAVATTTAFFLQDTINSTIQLSNNLVTQQPSNPARYNF